MALGPVLVRPVLAVVGWPLRRLGPVGRLAVGGVGGAPRRAAAVSVVVALGVTLIAGVVVGGASVRVLADREMALVGAGRLRGDRRRRTPGRRRPGRAGARPAGAGPRDAVPAARERARSARPARSRSTPTTWTWRALPDAGQAGRRAGSLADLGPGRVVLSGFAAGRTGLRVGRHGRARRPAADRRVTVAAVLPDSAPLGSAMVADPADLTRLGAPAAYSGLLADAAGAGEDGRTAGLQALRQAIGGSAGVGVDRARRRARPDRPRCSTWCW